MAKKPATVETDAAVKRCIDAFYAAYVRRHNPPEEAERWLRERDEKRPHARSQDDMVLPRIDGAKDGALTKKMLAAWGERTVLRLIEDFFGAAYAEWGVYNSAQNVGALYAAAPRLLVRQQAPDRRTAGNILAAQQAMEPEGGE